MSKGKRENSKTNGNRQVTEQLIERVFLAEECRANGDDSSSYVIAILTNEATEQAAYEKAEETAAKHEANIISCHDGGMDYRVVRADGNQALTDGGKLAFLLGMLEGTTGSVCDYSAEALIDRMKYMAAYIKDDQKGMKRFGELCHKEREQLPSTSFLQSGR